MKRLSASLAVSLLVIGTSVIWSAGAWVGHPSNATQIKIAANAQNLTGDQKLEHHRKQLETAKKELHDLLDRRLTILRSMVDLRLKHVAAVTGGAVRTPSSMQHKVALDKELSQLDSALQTEIESQRKQVSNLARQIQKLTQQIAKAEEAGAAAEG